MKTFRDRFEENYVAYEEPWKNKKGFRIQYEYVGPWYGYKLTEDEKKRYKRIFFGLCILSTFFYTFAALQKYELNTHSFPVLFIGLSMATFLFEWFGIFKFLLAGEKLTEENFKEMDGILKIVPYINGVLLLGAAISGSYMLIGSRFSPGMWMVPLFYLLAGCCSALIGFFYQALPYEKRKNQALDDDSKNRIHI